MLAPLIMIRRFNLFSASACPSGYRYHPGDKFGHQSEIENKILPSIHECAAHCNTNTKCRSIEWSDLHTNCVLLTAIYADGPQWQDYRFCSKLEGIYSSICNFYLR